MQGCQNVGQVHKGSPGVGARVACSTHKRTRSHTAALESTRQHRAELDSGSRRQRGGPLQQQWVHSRHHAHAQVPHPDSYAVQTHASTLPRYGAPPSCRHPPVAAQTQPGSAELPAP